MGTTQKTVEERLDDLERKMDHIVNILGINSLRPKSEVPDDVPPIPQAVAKVHTSSTPAKFSRPSDSSLNLLPIMF